MFTLYGPDDSISFMYFRALVQSNQVKIVVCKISYTVKGEVDVSGAS